MKVGCSFCTVHFQPDFDKTLESPCNFWGERGLANLPVELKRKVWDWVFSFPADEVYCATGEKVQMSMNWTATPVVLGTKFTEIVANWNHLTDEQRKEFERNWLKERASGTPVPPLPIHYGK